MICRILVSLPVLAYAVAANADDITLQVGGRFSIYVPSSCHRAEQSNFSLVLDCDFQGKAVRFYMKEFPAQLGEEFDPRKFPPSKLTQNAYLDSAMRAVIGEFDPGMGQRLKFLSWGSNTGEDVDALFWQDGYLFGEDARSYENVRKCVFLRVQTYRRGFSAVLFAISDIDRLTLENASLKCRGLPGEVSTILGSLGGMFEGGRFLRSSR